MRTTLNLDDDVLFAVKHLSRQKHEPIGKLLSAIVRCALTPEVKGQERNGVPLFPVKSDGGVVTMELVNRLRDELP